MASAAGKYSQTKTASIDKLPAATLDAAPSILYHGEASLETGRGGASRPVKPCTLHQDCLANLTTFSQPAERLGAITYWNSPSAATWMSAEAVTPLDFLHQQRAAISGFLQSLEAACRSCESDKEDQSRAVLESEGRRAVLFLEQQADEWRAQLELEVSGRLPSIQVVGSMPPYWQNQLRCAGS